MAIENQINSNLSRISSELRQLNNQQLTLGNAVTELSTVQQNTRDQIQQLQAVVESFIASDRRDKTVQTARTELLRLDNLIESRFGHYAEVRRHATGTLQAMDSGIVGQDTLRFATEGLMLGTPGYWLAPALVALASWIRNDRALAERALAEALRRDNDKTSLFFALVLRRHRRDEACARWISQYTARQDPNRLPQEFTVVLDAVATGSLGPLVRPAVAGVLTGWLERAADNPEMVEDQVARWQQLLDGLRLALPDDRYPVLRTVSPSWPQLKAGYEGATVHARAEGYFRQQFEGPVPVDPGLTGRIDGILNGLVTHYDPEEAEVRRKESELQALIDHDGDEAAAQAAVEARAATHDATVPLPTLITNVAFFPDRSEVSPATQRLAIACARGWIATAHDRLTDANEKAMPESIDIAVEGWRGSITGDSSADTLVNDAHQHIERDIRTRIAAVKLTTKAIAAGVGGVVLAVIALSILLGGGTGFGVFLLLIAGGLGLRTGTEYRRLPARREELRRQGRTRKAEARTRILAAVAEATDLTLQWEKEAAKAGSFTGYLATLSPAAFMEPESEHTREVMSR